MTWLQTLLIAAVPSAVTVLGLGWQLRMTNRATAEQRREDASEREQDREADRRAREEARRHALDDHWRAERTRAHGEFIALLGQAVNFMTVFIQSLRTDSEDGVTDGDTNKMMPREFEDQLRRAMADVNMYGGDESRAAGVHCWDVIWGLQNEVFFSIMLTPEPLTKRRDLSKRLGNASTMRGDYINAVRRELGTSD